MAGGGRGPTERTLPPRSGLAGKTATALGKVLTAATQAGPIKYTNAAGGEYATVHYLAMNITAPKNVKDIIQPLLAQGSVVTHGTTHESLNGWNMVVDVSTTREETMALPQRIDALADCLRKEGLQPKKTVFLALYGGKGVSIKTDLMVVARQVSAAVSQFHVVMVCLPDPAVLAQWDRIAAPVAKGASPAASKGGKGSKGTAGAANAGRGGARVAIINTVAAKPVPRPSTGRGAGKGGKSRTVITNEVVQQPRVAGKGKGGKAGGKGGKKGGKGAVDIGGGLLQKTNRSGQVTFSKKYSPY